MLKTLQIQNFKGWKDTGEIQLAPITLFFGANSSGKSSIGQFLMMLKQTTEYSSDRQMVLLSSGDEKALVNVGNYENIIFQHNSANQLTFRYSWTLENTLTLADPLDKRKKFSGNDIAFSCEFASMPKNEFIPKVQQFSYELRHGEKSVLNSTMRLHKDGYDISSSTYNFVRNPGRGWKSTATLHFYGFPNELINYYQNAAFLQDIAGTHEAMFAKMSYLGPIRQSPSYLYSWSGYSPNTVGIAGKDTIAALLAGQLRRFVSSGKRNSLDLQSMIASSLKRMGLIDSFGVNMVSKAHQQYEVKVCTKGSKDQVNLPDVGFGISQVLPVLTELFYAPSKAIIIIEQPELHLHPKAQAELADVMIDAIKTRENGEPRNIQLLIETHSEHFLRRFQRRIAEDAIDSNTVKAYFADSSECPAQLKALELDKFGNIANWPKDFFGDEMGDITAQMKAGMKKRLAEG